MKLKQIILFLVLLLPVLIFLFLKGFGKNQFDIPVLYENGVADTLLGECQRSTAAPYLVTGSPVKSGGHTIYHFERAEGPLLLERLEELERVQDALSGQEGIALHSLLRDSLISRGDIEKYNDRVRIKPSFWQIQSLNAEQWSRFKHCDLVMSSLDNRVVLVDNENRIRGYYDIIEREETDRLILELKILLTNN